MSVRRSLILLTIVVLAFPAAYFSYSNRQVVSENEAEIERLSNLEFHVVGRGEVERTVPAIGEIEADELVSLSFLTSGRVDEILVEEGDFVVAGEELIRLENEAERIAYDQALLRLELAELQLSDLVDVDPDDIRNAEALVDSAWGAFRSIDEATSPEDLAAAELRVQQAIEGLVGAESARRIAGGLNPPAIAELDAQIGEASFEVAVAQLQLQQLQDRDEADLNSAYARVVEAQRQLDQVSAGATEFQISRAETAIEEALFRLDQAETQFNRTILTAEFDGLVSALDIEEGELITANEPALDLLNTDLLYITAEVDEVDIRAVEEGMPARIELDALPDTLLPGELSLISDIGISEDGIVSYDVRVSLLQFDPRIRVGMTAEASVITDTRDGVLVVPNIFLRLAREQGVGFVERVQENGEIEEVEVALGLQGEENTEILSGLEEGDVIVIDLSGDAINFFGG